MRSCYDWILSSRLFPEAARFDDPNEIHGILESSLTPLRSFLVVGGFVVWVLVVVFVCRSLAPSLGASASVAQVAIQPIGMLAGFYWLFNSGLRTPFQRALRKALQHKGVPICIGCGYDLRGQTEARCSECSRPFPADLLERPRDCVSRVGA